MNSESELTLCDAVEDAMGTFEGVSQALRYVSEASTDYEMAHMLSNSIDVELRRLNEAIPESWREDRI